MCVHLLTPLLSGRGRGGLEEASLSEVSDDERHGDQRDADPHRGEELVHGVGQHEGARARRQFGLHHRLTEANLVQHHSHVKSTASTKNTVIWVNLKI